jgi:peptidoglycan/xylan/chitin deacetylase (PgdA/CDA1 family)
MCLALCSFAAWFLPANMPAGERLPNDPLNLAAPLDPMEVALTVDDLPAYDDPLPGLSREDIVMNVIGALNERGLGGVYGFSNGKLIEQDPGLLKVLQAWVMAGHYLGNHGFSHLDLTTTSERVFIEDIKRMERLISSVGGESWGGMKMFRYPLLREGETIAKRNRIRLYLRDQGYVTAHATVGYADWAWAKAYRRCSLRNDERQIAWLRQHVIDAARRSLRRSQQLAKLVAGRDVKHILIVHLSALNALWLHDVLQALQSDGVTFIDLKTALQDSIYETNPNLPLREGYTLLEQMALMKHIDDPYRDVVYPPERLEGLCRA